MSRRLRTFSCSTVIYSIAVLVRKRGIFMPCTFSPSGWLRSWPSEKCSSLDCCSHCKSLWIRALERRLRCKCLYEEYKVAMDCMRRTVGSNEKAGRGSQDVFSPQGSSRQNAMGNFSGGCIRESTQRHKRMRDGKLIR